MPRWPKEEKEENNPLKVDFKKIHPDLPEIDLSKSQGDTFNLPKVENTRTSAEQQAWVDMIHSRIDALVLELAEYQRMFEPVLLPLIRVQAEAQPEHAKVLRRRSLDEMQFALRRLMSPEPRPADDDSPQVLQDAINETIHLRQIISDLMQDSTNLYQRGLSSIRAMTEK